MIIAITSVVAIFVGMLLLSDITDNYYREKFRQEAIEKGTIDVKPEDLE